MLKKTKKMVKDVKKNKKDVKTHKNFDINIVNEFYFLFLFKILKILN